MQSVGYRKREKNKEQIGQIKNKYQDCRFKYNNINNHIKFK